MALSWIVSFVLFVLFAYSKGDVCQSPQVSSEAYTTLDATVVSHVVFVAEFSLTCANGIKNINLYADINGRIVPVVQSQDGNKFQVSWTSLPKKAHSGTYPVHVYDEEGYAALRKAQRSGDDATQVKPLFTVDVYHYGTYTGPWFQSEFLAALVAIGVWYVAYTSKSKLTS